MSRNATACWSGYAHQGKIGLLVALYKIRELNFADLEEYHIELETQEDVKLVKDDEAIEVHQVKAYLSANYASSYTDALKKFEACEGKNYLHTICEITTWDTMADDDNPEKVERYPYSSTKNYCPLNEIDPYILEEIKAILRLHGHAEWDNEGWCRGGFSEYLAVLDDRIRTEHQSKTQANYQVRFKLAEIMNLLVHPPVKYQAVVCAIRQEIYKQYVTFIEELENRGYPNMSPEHEACVSNIIRQISLMDDAQLEDFLNQIFPSSTLGKKLGTCTLTHDFFAADAFAATFLYTLITIDKQQLLLEGGSYPHYKVNYNYLLTAIHSSEVRKPMIARNILNNPKLNAVRYETDFIINETYSGMLEDCAGKVVPRGSELFKHKELKFVTRENAINDLNI